MATIYFTASSLDGFVVDEADSLDWLVTREFDPNGAFGYDAFAEGVGAIAMGSSTYEWIVKNHPGEWMYSQPCWVLTSRTGLVQQEHPVQAFDGDVARLHTVLLEAAGDKDVWVMGGGQTAAQFVAAGLVDELVVTYTPCSLGAGARLLPIRSEWELQEVARNGEFVCARWRGAPAIQGSA
ncbi:dihydrofolate reductase family protein [Mycobacterium sp. NPDC003323]